MKKIFLTTVFLLTSVAGGWAQTEVTLTQGGTLSTFIKQPSKLTELTVKGPMNDADYLWLRENCINLKQLDLSGVTTTSIPANAFSVEKNTTNTATSFSLKLNGVAPRYTKNGVQVIFLDKTTQIEKAVPTFTLAEGATVSPDPRNVTFTDCDIQTFHVTAADGKTTAEYSFVATLDDWFAMIVGGDTEIGKENMYYGDGKISPTLDMEQPYYQKMADLCQKETDTYTFGDFSFIKPKVEMVFSLGDMDKDRDDHSNIKKCFDLVTATKTPLLCVFGNHDWDPENWSKSGGTDFGFTKDAKNKEAISTVKDYVSKSSDASAMNTPITDVRYFEECSGDVKPAPYTFRYRGVRFFMAGNYWFQPSYSKNYLYFITTVSTPDFYAPDPVINALDKFLDTDYKDEPAVWMQHFPMVHGSDIGRWWTNQSEGYTSVDEPSKDCAPFSYNLSTEWVSYSSKLNKYKSMIRKTTNPVHFSGHFHYYATDTMTDGFPAISDYVCGYQGGGENYLVLVRESKGVVSIMRIDLKD